MRLKKLIATIICMVMLASTVSVNANQIAIYNSIDMTNGTVVADFYDNLMDYIIKEYRFDITKEELVSTAVKKLLTEHPELYTELAKGAFEALDENSSFYTLEEFSDVYSDVSGIYVGIGIQVHQDGGKVIVGEPIENSPAVNSGLRIGDVIVAVNGEDVTEYALDKVTSLIKGNAGTDVAITVRRNKEEYTYTITRAEIKINPVTYYMIDDTDIGYIKLSAFNASTADAIDEAMEYFGSKGVESVVLDLRNNLGGYLTAAVAVASYFIPDGKLIVTEEHKNQQENVEFYANKTDYKFKAAVLINEYSASASEVVASALRDYGCGVLVGKRSYGKGTVQSTIPIKSIHVLWMTVAEYYTPSHTAIHKEGLQPDYIVANGKTTFNMNNVTAYDITRVLSVGDEGDDVYAVEERLKALGYTIVPDNIYDGTTEEMVEDFQEDKGLFPYGVADITTQIKINDVLRDMEVVVDNQMEKAIEIAKTLK